MPGYISALEWGVRRFLKLSRRINAEGGKLKYEKGKMSGPFLSSIKYYIIKTIWY